MASAWAKFREDAENNRKSLDLRHGEECFFRGHGQTSWTLDPSLLRRFDAEDRKDREKIRSCEASLFFEFRARARELHKETPSDWDLLFHMRHHGVATRLLDWTEVLGVAVYFALLNAGEEKEEEPCVWMLNPYALNEKTKGIRDLVAPEYLTSDRNTYSDYLLTHTKHITFEWERPVALYPIQKNARLRAQRGYFTIHGEDSRPLEEAVPDVVKRIDLPRAAFGEAREFLRDAGIDEYSLFPDLDGLARYLAKKYGE